MRLRHSIGIIAINAERTIRYALAGVYAFAHEIIIVEGQAGPEAAFMANEDGGSLDDTMGAILSFPDPDRKIRTIHGTWADKTEQSNAYAREATGDWLWQVDADEVWNPEALQALDLTLAHNDYDVVVVGFWHYWHDLLHVGVGGPWDEPRARAWRRNAAGIKFRTHWPPTLEGGPEAPKVLDISRDPEFRVHHLSYDDAREVESKLYYHTNRGYPNLRTWYRDVWLPWRVPEGKAALTDSHPTAYASKTVGGVAQYAGPKRPQALESLVRAHERPLRVLHILPSVSAGGGCKATYALMELGPASVEQRIACCGPVDMEHCDMRGIWRYQTTALAEALDWADVVRVVWWRHLPEWPQIAAAKKPIMLHVMLGPWRDLCLPEFRRWHFDGEDRQAAEVVYVTRNAMRAAIADGLSPETATLASVIHDGTDLVPFQWARLRQRDRKLDGFVIGVPGHYYNLKSPTNLPEIIQAIKAVIPEARFRCPGVGPWVADFRDRSGNHCDWLGFVDDMPAEIANWDLLLSIYPQHSTCASESIAQEAMAAGVATVLRPCDTLHDWISASGGGLVLRPTDGPREIADAVLGLVKTPGWRTRLGERARNYAVRHLGAYNALREHVPLWHKMANRTCPVAYA